ncbi:c-type cytochrome [Aliiroseovarius sp.]|uniref:c-type cytochrome n=1 Tax=Aliiroseovarius sp. TaxID=1872442 RepID=UPI003BAB4CBE
MKRMTLILGGVLAAGMALAHDGVQNPAVMARMEAMKQIGGGMKVLAGMLKGEMTYDTAEAQAALDKIEEAVGRVPALFEAPESDPKSTALPVIWENWEDFESKIDALAKASMGEITDEDSLKMAVSTLGGTCKDCHGDYRQKQ